MNTILPSPLLILAATKEELSPLIAEFEVQPLELSGLRDLFKTTIGQRDVFFLLTGVGKKQVRYRLKKVLPEIRPKLIISIGAAGGIDPDHRVGDNVMSEVVLYESLQGEVELPCRGVRRRFSCQELSLLFGISVKRAKYSLTVNRALGKREKMELQESGIDFIDMETWHIAKAARELIPDCPVVSLRAISDTVEMELPPMESLIGSHEKGEENMAKTHFAHFQKAVSSNTKLLSPFLQL